MALVNVGDSRTYLLRHGRLRRVTVDHSYVQELVATGHITDDEARTHPRRNIVTRALGIDPAVRVDAWTLPLVRGDRFLLCSDGLVDEVRDDEIVDVLDTIDDPQAAADELVALANRQGGRDNITVVVVDVVEGADPPDPDSELDLEPAWDDGTADEHVGRRRPRRRGHRVRGPRRARQRRGPRRPPTDETTAAASADTTDDAAGGRPPTTAETPPTAPPPRRRKRRARPASSAASACSPCSCWRSSSPPPGPGAASSSPSTTPTSSSSTAARPAASCGSIRPWKHRPCSPATQLDDDSIERVEREPSFDSRRAAERFVAEQLETTTTTIDDHHDHDDHHGPGHHDHADDRRAVMAASSGVPAGAGGD